MTGPIAALILALVFSGPDNNGNEIRHVPSIIFGQILLGPGASRYETIFTVLSKKQAPATLDLFADKGEPLIATFVDSSGVVVLTGSTFRFVLAAGKPLTIKIQLTPEELTEDVLVKTGWANFNSSTELDVRALIRIVKPDGTLIGKHVVLSEKLTHG